MENVLPFTPSARRAPASPSAGMRVSERDGAAEQILGLLKEVGFVPCRLPHLSNQAGMWAPSDAIYAERDYLLKSDVRRAILRVVKCLASLGFDHVDLYVGKNDPHCFQRAQLLDHHLPLRVSGTRTYIGVIDNTDGLVVSV